MYNWESSNKQKGKKAKKTGTVVLHNDASVDLSFERLLKEVVVGREDERQPESDSERPLPKKSALMTPATVASLKSTMGFSELLPSQAQCYRGVFKGRDTILHSRTGSGKTLAYALPIVERHLLDDAASNIKKVGPFCLVFVFSDDLAFQTQGVLQKVYPSLAIGVAGKDKVTKKRFDIIIGTVETLDTVIRGTKSRHDVRPKRQRDDADDDCSDISSSDDDDDEEADVHDEAVVDVSQVRAIVIDEVDTTLGPRYSKIGRRMRNLLKVIRRANGSLSESLLNDFRSHHYVLCGATIPNWVIKAGFLGLKKYYYQLVGAGSEKLPPQLECFSTSCTGSQRVERAAEIIKSHPFGRTVVFGTEKQMQRLYSMLPTAAPSEGAAGTASKKNVAKKQPVRHPVARALLPTDDKNSRIQAIEDFNSKAANILLCTDQAARGLDFADVDMVMMVSLPAHNMAAEVFVHRAGRTARVGKPGRCLVLEDPRHDALTLDSIAKHTHVTFKKLLEVETASATTTKLQLKVKGSFGTASAAKPEDVLKQALGEDTMRQLVNNVKHPNPAEQHIVTFEVPTGSAHIVTAKLWKYDVREVK